MIIVDYLQMPAYYEAGLIEALDTYMPASLKSDLIPSVVAESSYRGKLISTAQFDAGMGLWANKAMLQKAGVRIPVSYKEAWSKAEFEDVLKKLKLSGVPYPIYIRQNKPSTLYFTYMPILASFGGDYIDRKTFHAKGVLDGANTVAAYDYLSWLLKQGYLNGRCDYEDAFYGKKESALALIGHWKYTDHVKNLGDDAIIIPTPNFGKGVFIVGHPKKGYQVGVRDELPQLPAGGEHLVVDGPVKPRLGDLAEPLGIGGLGQGFQRIVERRALHEPREEGRVQKAVLHTSQPGHGIHVTHGRHPLGEQLLDDFGLDVGTDVLQQHVPRAVDVDPVVPQHEAAGDGQAFGRERQRCLVGAVEPVKPSLVEVFLALSDEDDLAFGADGLLQQRVRERHVLVARHLGHLAEGRREGLVHEVLANSQVHLLRVEPGDDLPALQDLGLLPGNEVLFFCARSFLKSLKIKNLVRFAALSSIVSNKIVWTASTLQIRSPHFKAARREIGRASCRERV